MSGVLLCGDSRLSHRPLTCHSHEAEIVTRARYFTEKCTRTTAHDRSVHHAATRVTCGTIRVSVLSLEDITRGKGNFIQHARTQLNNRACARRMAEQTGIHDVIFRANAKKCMPGHVLELFVPALMLPRACAVHARNAHSRREHKMGDKCIPAAPIWLLMPILASIMTLRRWWRSSLERRCRGSMSRFRGLCSCAPRKMTTLKLCGIPRRGWKSNASRIREKRSGRNARWA